MCKPPHVQLPIAPVTGIAQAFDGTRLQIAGQWIAIPEGQRWKFAGDSWRGNEYRISTIKDSFGKLVLRIEQLVSLPTEAALSSCGMD